MAKIVETDNFGGDYPNEKFLNIGSIPAEAACRIANAINNEFPKDYSRFWKVVHDEYKLQPGFEP